MKSFDYAMTTVVAFCGKPVVSPMHKLHKQALKELEKENPDLSIVDTCIKQMEILADTNAQPKPNFPKGGR